MTTSAQEIPESAETYDKVSMNIPHSLLEKIDAAAKADDRNRTSWLIKNIRKILEAPPIPTSSALINEDPATYRTRKDPP